MKRIGLTQRVEIVTSHGERRDCLDQRWAKFISRLGFCPVPLANETHRPRDYVEALSLDGAVLTGGNDLEPVAKVDERVPERDRFERFLIEYCRTRSVPVIGVCRGAQMLNAYFGGSIVAVAGHVRSRHKLEHAPAAAALPLATDVNSYHAFGITEGTLATALKPLARTMDGSIEAFTDESGSCVGILWHPEREEPFSDLDLALFSHAFTGQVLSSTINARRSP